MIKNTTILFITLFSHLPLTAQWTEITYCNQTIFDLKSFDNKLFLAGNFTENEGIDSYWSAYYDGTSMHRHPTALGGGGLLSLDVFNGVLYGVGSISHGPTSGISKWTGTSWVSGGVSSQSHSAIFTDGNDLYVGSGFGGVSIKTGTDPFVSMPSMDETTDAINAITKYNGQIIIAGDLTSYNSVALGNIAAWDGTAWQPLGSGLSGEVKCMIVYNDELYVGGMFNLAGGSSAKHIARWNGTSWSI